MAGFAFNMTRTTACHSISYPMTYIHGIEHGFAVAVTLAQVADINMSACDISEVLDVFSHYDGMQAWIDCVCDGIISLRLREFGIYRHDIDLIADNCLNSDRMNNNPVDLSIKQIKDISNNILIEILEELYRGKWPKQDRFISAYLIGVAGHV